MRLVRLAALSLLLLPATGARADDIGPAQADALQQQLKDWAAGLLGPSVKLPDLPWRVTGARDHYVIAWPIPNLTGPDGTLSATANVRPLDSGRWSIDSLTLPSPGSFSMTIPDTDTPLTAHFAIGKQDTHGVIDPTFATESTLHGALNDLTVTTDGPKQHQEQRLDRYLVDTSVKPAQGGRLNVVMDTAVTNWKSASQINGSKPVAIGVQTMHAIGRVNGVNRDRVAALLAATGGLIGALPPDVMKTGETTSLPAPARSQLRLVIDSLQDMLTSVSLEETLEGVQVEMAGMGGMSVKRFSLGTGGEATDGRLHAWVDLVLDELASPSLPPKIAAFLPHHVEIKPSLSGVLTADLHKLALDATDEGVDTDSLAPDIAAIFSHGGIDLGVETLSFDLGAAKVDGTGQLKVVSPGSWHGEAHLVAKGFDDLTAQARSSPELQQALPVLVMLRGLAKPDGDKLVWDIVSDGPSVTVNGLDLSQLSGGSDQPKGKPPARKSGQPPSR